MDTITAKESKTKLSEPKTTIFKKIKKRYSWAWNCIGIQMLITQGLSFLLMIILTVILSAKTGANAASEIQKYTIPIAALCFCIGNPLSAFISLKATKAAKFSDYFKKPRISAGLVILAVLATLGISSVDSIIMNIFKSVFSASSEQLSDSISNGVFSENIVLSIVSIAYVCVLGPFFEELLCRGAIQSIGGHISPGFAVFISAFMFGIFHLNISQFYNAFLLGILLGYVTLRSRSLWPAVIMHIANNSLSVLEMVIIKDMSEDKAASLIGIVTIVLAVVGMIALITFIILEKKNNNKEMVVMTTNRPSTEEVISTGTKGMKLTVLPFFTRWQSFVIIAFFILMCVSQS